MPLTRIFKLVAEIPTATFQILPKEPLFKPLKTLAFAASASPNQTLFKFKFSLSETPVLPNITAPGILPAPASHLHRSHLKKSHWHLP